MNRRHLGFVSALSLFAACASTDVAPSFDSTRVLVAARTGASPERVRTAEEARAVELRVAKLLSAPLDERSAVEIALLHEPTAQATLERLGIAQADLAQATRIGNPIFSWARLALRGGSGAQESWGLELPLLDFLVQPLRRKLGEMEVERVRYEVGSVLLESATEARRAVIEAQAAEQLLARLEQLAALDRAAADYAEKLFEAGNLTALDLAQSRAAFAQRSLEVSEARNELRHARERVHRALGLSGTQIAWTLGARELPEPLDEDEALEGLETRAITERLDLSAARSALAVMDRAIQLERRSRFSPVGIDVGVETEREVDGARITGPSLRLQIPIFDSGKVSLAKLAAERRQMAWQLEALAVHTRSEVRESWGDVRAAKDRYRFLRSSLVPLSQQIVDLELRRYNSMLAGTFDLLGAKSREVEAEKMAVRALADYWLARVDLEAAIGGPLSKSQGDSQ